MEWLEHFILLHSEKQEILSVREKQEGALLQDIFLQPYLGLGPALVLQWTLPYLLVLLPHYSKYSPI